MLTNILESGQVKENDEKDFLLFYFLNPNKHMLYSIKINNRKRTYVN